MKAKPTMYFVIFKDLTYKEIDNLDEFMSNQNEIDNTLYIIKQFHEGRIHTTSHDNDYPLYEYVVYHNNLIETKIEFSGVQCTSFKVYKKYLYHIHIGAYISDINNNTLYKDFRSPLGESEIDIIIDIIKFVRELAKFGTWQAYDKAKKIPRWLLVDKNLNVKEYISPRKYLKGALYWINFFPNGEVHTTSSDNTSNLYSYQIYNRSLKQCELTCFDWKCSNIHELQITIYGIRFSYKIHDRDDITSTFTKNLPYDRSAIISHILNHLISLGESGDWDTYLLKSQRPNMKYLKKTNQILKEKIIDLEKKLKINMDGIEKHYKI